jgi:nucleotide-binding universal stress UspA family protein
MTHSLAPIRSILVQLDGTPSSASRLQLARRLALAAQAQLHAMFVGSPPQRPVQLAISESPAALLQTVDWAAVARARSMFDDAVAEEGSPPMRWLDSNGVEPAEAFFRQALYVDLLVLGQHDPSSEPGTGAPAGFVESALIDTGKPALVVPHTGSFQVVGHEVLVGWNATPQAARAVVAALPWARGARHVHVLESAQASSRRGSDELDIAQYLHGHAVSATLHRGGRAEGDAGDALLSLASDVDADLLVMGCYGHSRARELMLGGATRTVLQTMTLPVLMAH